MSKRNFTLFIIVLMSVILVIFGFLYFNQSRTGQPGDEGTNFLSQFNPFGTSTQVNPTDTTTPVDLGDQTSDETEEETPEKLKKISSMPVAGFELFLKERLKEVGEGGIPVPPASPTTPSKTTTKPVPPETELVLATRYVARATGNIFQTFLDKLEERRFSSTTIPKIYEAYFGGNHASVIMRYLKTDNKTVQTFLGSIPKEVLGADTESNEITGTFLPDDITDLSLSPDTTKLFYLLNVGNNAIGTTLNLSASKPSDVGKKTQIFDSPFTEWLSSWSNVNMITLGTKPSASVPGHMYVVNPTTKSFSRVLGDINGLTALLSPDGKSILYSDNSLSLSIYNISNATRTPVGVRTLPEKCVWNSGSTVLYCAVPGAINSFQYPDVWYQGEESFVDQIWKIDIVNGLTTMLADPAVIPGGENIDGIKLAIDKNEKYLLFVNKKDSFLWGLNLE